MSIFMQSSSNLFQLIRNISLLISNVFAHLFNFIICKDKVRHLSLEVGFFLSYLTRTGIGAKKCDISQYVIHTCYIPLPCLMMFRFRSKIGNEEKQASQMTTIEIKFLANVH